MAVQTCESCGSLGPFFTNQAGYSICQDCGQHQLDVRQEFRDEEDLAFEATGERDFSARLANVKTRTVGAVTVTAGGAGAHGGALTDDEDYSPILADLLPESFSQNDTTLPRRPPSENDFVRACQTILRALIRRMIIRACLSPELEHVCRELWLAMFRAYVQFGAITSTLFAEGDTLKIGIRRLCRGAPFTASISEVRASYDTVNKEFTPSLARVIESMGLDRYKYLRKIALPHKTTHGLPQHFVSPLAADSTVDSTADLTAKTSRKNKRRLSYDTSNGFDDLRTAPSVSSTLSASRASSRVRPLRFRMLSPERDDEGPSRTTVGKGRSNSVRVNRTVNSTGHNQSSNSEERSSITVGAETSFPTTFPETTALTDAYNSNLNSSAETRKPFSRRESESLGGDRAPSEAAISVGRSTLSGYSRYGGGYRATKDFVMNEIPQAFYNAGGKHNRLGIACLAAQVPPPASFVTANRSKLLRYQRYDVEDPYLKRSPNSEGLVGGKRGGLPSSNLQFMCRARNLPLGPQDDTYGRGHHGRLGVSFDQRRQTNVPSNDWQTDIIYEHDFLAKYNDLLAIERQNSSNGHSNRECWLVLARSLLTLEFSTQDVIEALGPLNSALAKWRHRGLPTHLRSTVRGKALQLRFANAGLSETDKTPTSLLLDWIKRLFSYQDSCIRTTVLSRHNSVENADRVDEGFVEQNNSPNSRLVTAAKEVLRMKPLRHLLEPDALFSELKKKRQSETGMSEEVELSAANALSSTAAASTVTTAGTAAAAGTVADGDKVLEELSSLENPKNSPVSELHGHIDTDEQNELPLRSDSVFFHIDAGGGQLVLGATASLLHNMKTNETEKVRTPEGSRQTNQETINAEDSAVSANPTVNSLLHHSATALPGTDISPSSRHSSFASPRPSATVSAGALSDLSTAVLGKVPYLSTERLLSLYSERLMKSLPGGKMGSDAEILENDDIFTKMIALVNSLSESSAELLAEIALLPVLKYYAKTCSPSYSPAFRAVLIQRTYELISSDLLVASRVRTVMEPGDISAHSAPGSCLYDLATIFPQILRHSIPYGVALILMCEMAELPPLNFTLLLTVLWLTFLTTKHAVIAQDICRWLEGGAIPLNEAALDVPVWLFERGGISVDNEVITVDPSGKNRRRENIDKDRSVLQIGVFPRAQELEFCASQLLRAQIGINLPPFNCKAFVPRILHHLRLPDCIQPLVCNFLKLFEKPVTQFNDGYRNWDNDYFAQIPLQLYGSLGAFPAPVTVAITVLIACRLLWPIFILPPTGLPLSKSDSTTFVKNSQQDALPLQFNGHAWVVGDVEFPLKNDGFFRAGLQSMAYLRQTWPSAFEILMKSHAKRVQPPVSPYSPCKVPENDGGDAPSVADKYTDDDIVVLLEEFFREGRRKYFEKNTQNSDAVLHPSLEFLRNLLPTNQVLMNSVVSNGALDGWLDSIQPWTVINDVWDQSSELDRQLMLSQWSSWVIRPSLPKGRFVVQSTELQAYLANSEEYPIKNKAVLDALNAYYEDEDNEDSDDEESSTTGSDPSHETRYDTKSEEHCGFDEDFVDPQSSEENWTYDRLNEVLHRIYWDSIATFQEPSSFTEFYHPLQDTVHSTDVCPDLPAEESRMSIPYAILLRRLASFLNADALQLHTHLAKVERWLFVSEIPYRFAARKRAVGFQDRAVPVNWLVENAVPTRDEPFAQGEAVGEMIGEIDGSLFQNEMNGSTDAPTAGAIFHQEEFTISNIPILERDVPERDGLGSPVEEDMPSQASALKANLIPDLPSFLAAAIQNSSTD